MIDFNELSVRAGIGIGLLLTALFLGLNFFAKFPVAKRKQK